MAAEDARKDGSTSGASRGRREDRRDARRSHRDRSASASRSRRSSRRHVSSSKRRSTSRSRGRSRPSHRHRHRERSPRRDRSRSRSRERHKRRRRDSRDEGRKASTSPRPRSRSRSKSRRKASAKKGKLNEGQHRDAGNNVNDAIDKSSGSSQDTKSSSEQQTPLKLSCSPITTEVTAAEKSATIGVHTPPVVVDAHGDVVMESEDGVASEMCQVPPAAKNVVVEQSVEPAAKEVAQQETGSETSKQGQQIRAPLGKEEAGTPKSASPAAVDVNSLKMDVLKALAEARSTIAGIKQSGVDATVSVSKTTSPEPIAASTNTTQDGDMQRIVPASPPKKNEASLLSPRKADTLPVTTTEDSSADDFDMFSMAALDDHDDAMTSGASVAAITVNEVSLQSNCDDAEGYYSTTIGEVLDGKYRVLGAVGKGVFSTVLRCQCINPLRTASGGSMEVVAVKLIRNNDVMRDAAQTELKLLNELGGRDPRDKKHCIRLLDSFSHRNHVAMVFEPMQMNVREAMKKFGGKGGISIQAVRVFSKHMLIALNHLESCQVIHADIKPDNILLDEKQTTIKLCDFGSAFKADDGKQDPTPYLVSRFYRAPEIVLGLAYDKAVDMWSVGCCLFEMFTGKVMFPGSTNNEMLKLFMELKGKIPNKLIKKHRQAYIDRFEMEPHFTEDLKFCSRESDRVTGKPILRLMDTIKAKNDLASSLMGAKSTTDERKQVLELRNLLDRMFTLDPSKRISVREALAHPFVKG